MPESKTYVSLHSHSIYSNLDGLSTVKEIVERAVELKSPAVCITDHGFATSHYQLAELCEKNNIKPIFGVEGYLAPKDNTLKEKVEGFKSYYHLTLLAMNEVGYKNLMILIADSFMNGKYIKGRFDMNKLERYSEGIICLSACLGGVLSQFLLEDRDEEAENWALQFKEIYKDNFYIELTWTNLEQQDYVNKKLILLAEKIGVEIIITPDSHYTRVSFSPIR